MPADPFDIPNLFTDPSRRVSLEEYGEEWEENVAPSSGASATRAVRLLYDTRTLRWLLFIFVGFFFLLVMRLMFLQVAEGAELREAADGNRFRVLVEPAARGVVYDADRDPLVRNIPIYEVAVVPVDIPELDSDEGKVFLAALSSLLTVSVDELTDQIEALDQRSYEPAVILEEITREQALHLQARTLGISWNPGTNEFKTFI